MKDQINKALIYLSIVALLTLGGCRWVLSSKGPVYIHPIAVAHAHNDYEHRRPLFDALENGFCSVEADIHLVDGELLVAHDRNQATKGMTLQNLYLDPLRQRVSTYGGSIYPDGGEFTLMIDIKTDAEETYRVLHAVLGQYSSILSVVHGGSVSAKAVNVVISGNRPRVLMLSQSVRYAGYDGRLKDLDSEDPAHFMPWISEHFSKVTQWRGDGPMPQSDRKNLRSIVKRAHGKHRKVRFWATPDLPVVWEVLMDAGVDLINVDNLETFRKYYSERRSGKHEI
jgi:hypothetical protein